MTLEELKELARELHELLKALAEEDAMLLRKKELSALCKLVDEALLELEELAEIELLR